MDEKLLESYLEHIAEQVLDENKIVTYKSLSKSLGIHVNTAKQLLYVFITKEKAKRTFPISATYLVAGKVVDGSFNIAIVNEEDLKNAYSGFIEVTSEHVYSIQKAKSLKDVKLLCGVDLDVPKPKSCELVIKCSKAVLKSKKEVIKKPESSKAENKKIIAEAFGMEKEKVSTAEPKAKTSPKKPSPKSQEKAQGNKKPAGNISSFFAKGAAKNLEKTFKNEVDQIVRNKKETESKKDERSTSKERSELNKTEKRTEKKSEPKESFKRKKNGSKRKRIQMISDSEESESNEDENVLFNTEEDFPSSGVNLEEKEEPVEVVPRNKRKKRKVIDKTVMNEDGYLETKKEVVFETDSEDEPENPAGSKDLKKPKQESEKMKRAQGTSAPKKQPTLFTFFKKN